MNRSLHPVVRPTLALKQGSMESRRHRWIAHISLLASDLILVFFGFVLAYWMRYIAIWPDPLKPIVSEVTGYNYVPFDAFLPTTLLLMVVLTILFETKGLYRLSRGSGFLDYAGIILSSTLTGIALLIVVVFFYRPFYFSRLIFAFAGVNIVILLCLLRILLLGIRHWRWSKGIGQERILVIGGKGLGQQVMNGIAAQPGLGYHLVGYLDDHPISSNGRIGRIYRHVGALSDLEAVIQTRGIHHVILALPFWDHDRLLRLIQSCRTLGVSYHVVPDLYQLSFDRVDVLQISGVPLITPKEISLQGWNLALKRTMDIALAVLSLPLTLPLALLLALLIRLDSPGPAVFRQVRIGKDGQPFTFYKFRTMVVDAEARKAELSDLNEADGPLFKIRRDPRVTRVGRFLRCSSLDELPQLWSVLRGEMSLVGPRPALPEEVACYESWHRRRLEVTPGLTCLAQALGRSDVSFDEMVRLDIYYAENWSIGMDLRILLMTVPAVITGTGAY
ncbi:MAG: sugar transferase [Chloroflexales bacterium]|nr:sugar transferase [Chloroflexales bacterium]